MMCFPGISVPPIIIILSNTCDIMRYFSANYILIGTVVSLCLLLFLSFSCHSILIKRVKADVSSGVQERQVF